MCQLRFMWIRIACCTLGIILKKKKFTQLKNFTLLCLQHSEGGNKGNKQREDAERKRREKRREKKRKSKFKELVLSSSS